MNSVVNGNSWTLKFDNFSHLQNVINNNPPSPRKRHYERKLRAKIDMWLAPNVAVEQVNLKRGNVSNGGFCENS